MPEPLKMRTEKISQEALRPMVDFINHYSEQIEDFTRSGLKALNAANHSLDQAKDTERQLHHWLTRAQVQCQRLLNKLEEKEEYIDHETLIQEHKKLTRQHPLSNFLLTALVSSTLRAMTPKGHQVQGDQAQEQESSSPSIHH